jgi:DNA-directed RNA polymerase alpha subunit
VELILRLNSADIKYAVRMLLESRGYEVVGLGGDFYRNGTLLAELSVEVQVRQKAAEPTDDPKTWLISDPRLGLSNRLKHNLGRKQIKTVGDLLRHSEDELLAMRNVGWITVCDVRDRLEKHGLKLKGDQP